MMQIQDDLELNLVQIMANLDVGVDAKLWLKFVTHNKSVSGYFTSHGTKQRIVGTSDSGPSVQDG